MFLSAAPAEILLTRKKCECAWQCPAPPYAVRAWTAGATSAKVTQGFCPKTQTVAFSTHHLLTWRATGAGDFGCDTLIHDSSAKNDWTDGAAGGIQGQVRVPGAAGPERRPPAPLFVRRQPPPQRFGRFGRVQRRLLVRGQLAIRQTPQAQGMQPLQEIAHEAILWVSHFFFFTCYCVPFFHLFAAREISLFLLMLFFVCVPAPPPQCPGFWVNIDGVFVNDRGGGENCLPRPFSPRGGAFVSEGCKIEIQCRPARKGGCQNGFIALKLFAPPAFSVIGPSPQQKDLFCHIPARDEVFSLLCRL